MRAVGISFILLTSFSALRASDSLSIPPPILAVRTKEPITIDGLLTESVWQRPGTRGFVQHLPVEGASPYLQTEIWIAYDEEALYVAARMYDSSPDSIMQVLGRRDADIVADWFQFYVDPYFDKRSGYYFNVSAAGSLQDGTLYDDDWNDNSWDGVWEAKANIDEKGWTVEMRIPFTQLRFRQQQSYTWGVDFSRTIGRNNERDYLVATPLKESGFVSRFVPLVGIQNISPPQDVEILPYVTSRAEYAQHASGDPFSAGSRVLPGAGVDMKVGLGSNLTLSGTINPDFGQVEVDPAVVNLSDVETYFQEKRPFFIEGANTFRFGHGGSSNYWSFNWSDPTFFYSRRIGRNPQGTIPITPDFVDNPIGTHILGAGKITGKVGDNWNFGAIQAVTNSEFARTQTAGERDEYQVEPLTYYGIGRIQKDFNAGNQGLGFIGTATKRFFNDEGHGDLLTDEINSAAYVGGVDGWTFLDNNKDYVLTGWGGVSNIHGSPTTITALQTNSRHYFQRPDEGDLHVDSAATSLTGYAARLNLNKQKGPWMVNSAFGVIDPRFDVDDLGFLWRSDVVNYHTAVGYRWTVKTEYYNEIGVNAAAFGSNDFTGNTTWRGYFASGWYDFTNFYSLNLAYAYNPPSVDIWVTRGGPAVQLPIGREIDYNLSTDPRQPVVVTAYGSTYHGGGGLQNMVEVDVQYKPSPNLSVTVGPNYSHLYNEDQWVDSYADPTATATYGNQYVFAFLNQITLSANIRVDWTFTPQLSFQLYAQPLISSGAYVDLKRFVQPHTFNFSSYGKDGSTISRTVSSTGDVSYTVDADGAGPSPAYTFSDPNFNFRSLRGNAVLRWEYRPGSALYLVWTQSRSDTEVMGDFAFNHSLDRLVGAQPDNIFLLKFTYWLNM